MVKLSVKSDEGVSRELPDIFRAAREDDAEELLRALQAGQKLDEDQGKGTTPVHIACARRSNRFLAAALTHRFNPWIRDGNDRLAIDHAVANGLRDVQRSLHDMMYGGDWSLDNVRPLHEPT